MKALITGPRSHSAVMTAMKAAPGDKVAEAADAALKEHGERALELPYLSLVTEFEELPKPGEHIIINDGTSVVVERVMWWVNGPADHPHYYGFQGGTYDGAGEVTTIHIQVLPEDWSKGYSYDAGVKAGREKAVQELASVLSLLDGISDPEAVRSCIREWCRRESGAKS